jgi:hypothetical protein
MSEYVITIGGDRVKRVADIIKHRKNEARQHLKDLNARIDKAGLYASTIPLDIQRYWNNRLSEIEGEITELKALELIFTGAESIAITHKTKQKVEAK